MMPVDLPAACDGYAVSTLQNPLGTSPVSRGAT
jgi:hypothetical protein